MVDIILTILNSNIMCFVVIPLLVVIMGWIKDKNGIKKKNKELGYWMVKYQRANTFIDDAMKIYKSLAVCFVFVQIILLILCLWKGKLFGFIISGIINCLFSALICIIICKKSTNIIEFWTNGKSKRELVLCLFIIYWIPFFIQLYDKYMWIVECTFLVLLIIWILMLYMYCDEVFILENKYADIYVIGIEKAQSVEAGGLEKRGEWIIVPRYINQRREEIRIKESDIVRIDYYGGPIISVEKRNLIGKRVSF